MRAAHQRGKEAAGWVAQPARLSALDLCPGELLGAVGVRARDSNQVRAAPPAAGCAYLPQADPGWRTDATWLTSENEARLRLVSLVGPLVAEKLGVPYYRWKLPISGAGVAQLTDAERDALYANNPRLWGHFIPGAPCVLSENQGKIEWRISNGTIGKFYSVMYQGRETQLGERGALAGQVIDIEAPDAVNVEFPELAGVKALDYAGFTKVAGKVVLAIPASPVLYLVCRPPMPPATLTALTAQHVTLASRRFHSPLQQLLRCYGAHGRRLSTTPRCRSAAT